MSTLNYPEDLRYTTDHEWVQDKGEGVVRIGVTSYAADALGDIVYVSLPTVGESHTPGDSVGEIESTKSVSDIYAPVAGEVVAVNDTLDSTPELINNDSYGGGWMYEMRLEDPAALDGLMDSQAYQGQLD
ncbi:glycine cleavage system protein GcvH [Ornithinimicrobium cerasi]|uniref:Glycine cleavage system H protein n=1 Tax=Ornithinimicrobium cerasi TaxID=2248773 RepID=A0A285VP06_9MICO|nr:glycine cleavage system protein GcvH [Ornithinimicrobium cerasi]SOC54341.1 glycine cleavage system H protein [Ornithinimicrobium cerasi]